MAATPDIKYASRKVTKCITPGKLELCFGMRFCDSIVMGEHRKIGKYGIGVGCSLTFIFKN